MSESCNSKGADSKKSREESSDSKDNREPGECSSSSSSSPVVINIVDDDRRSEDGDDSGEDVIILSDSSDNDNMTRGDGNDSSIQLVDDLVDDGLFVVDRSGSIKGPPASMNADEGYESSKRKRRSPPLDISKVLTSLATPSLAPGKTENRFKVTCFNCGGDHTVEKCDIAHDKRKIAKNRAEYRNNRRSMNERYLDTSSNSSIRPGHISDELREALGIGPRDIPEWIYRMRQLGFVDGYPPAYLKQAIGTSEGALLEFHVEDGTFLSGSASAKKRTDSGGLPPRINADQIINYYGFNCYSHDLNDREQNFRVPDIHDFIDYHQVVLSERFWAEQRILENESSESKTHAKQRGSPLDENRKKQRPSPTDEDVEVIDVDLETDVEGDVCVLPSSPTIPAYLSQRSDSAAEGDVVTPKRVESSPALLGSSTGVLCGTPIALRANQMKKPGLDEFRAGVVPFKHEPDSTSHRGFFTALMKKIRKAL
ncbi:Uncharacterized protein Tcan_12290 [Toxocara canis]|uniref:PSP proline-rich domain-containing protein n=1 Tax=Toxocara canis TaxID=6265 RepID=A0A0B2VFF4_TOXCA|nr:Uncharacterized protein Tcan_12290 [Toxocara canis]